ncbi:alpha-amylase family glycosyl hydrolase [Allobaculum sp. Allo2]|uniref:alpha-amylase family glycosyl hydrolase n=1 Tax=Allobaculum sp. Allo2 TaxID=2853432 RepID=UPI0021131C1A|nr:alpha-amylase family glycosyl hydrolase [Allobaculum sp. Allo2]
MGSSNGPRVHEFLQEMNEQVLSRYDVMTVGETPNTTTKQALLFTDPARKELNMVFQFEHMHLDYGKYGKFSVERAPLADLKENLSKWQNDLEQGWNSLYWNNHDQPRAVSRYGDDQRFRIESAKMLGTLLHGMKGTPFVYMGEEIGQVNPEFERLEDYQDIETRAFIDLLRENGESEEFIRTVCHNGSRDNARTPMQWDSNKSNYGFSKASPGCPLPKPETFLPSKTR